MSENYKLSKTFEPHKIEQPIYEAWLQAKVFHAKPDQRAPHERYVIMMPLPNVTGALHMGHAMDNVMQDMLIRWHRMMGNNTLWMPGIDHAGIATQAVVEKRLKELEGLTRHDVGRDGLIERIWRWKEQSQDRIVKQQQRMGCSADWDRHRFTMDKVCTRAVRRAFFAMFRDGLIIRGKRLVNWDPYLRTSISDDEVYHETVQGHFWHLRYPVINPARGEPEFLVVATTRPETMLGDTAVAVHPQPDEAFRAEIENVKSSLNKAPSKDRHTLEAALADLEKKQNESLQGLLVLRDMAKAGRSIRLPLMDRAIPLICDEWAKPHLGSGCVKITPAHDTNDYAVWTRHKGEIDIINILNPDGTLNDNAGLYRDLDRFEARKKVVADLKKQGLLAEVEDRKIEIGHSDRSKTPIEPYLCDQWYIRMGDVDQGVVMGRDTPNQHNSPGLVQAAMDAALDGRVRFFPERFKKTYLDWLSEKRDWPISRQLWWGHRIPVWSKVVSLKNLDELVETLRKETLKDLWPSKSCIRVVNKESGISVLVGEQNIERVSKDLQDDSWLLDVCLLEQDADCEKRLIESGFGQDPDVLDTWFSSALWPHSTLGWPDPGTADTESEVSLGAVGGFRDCLDYYYPGSCLVTGRDIITLWVARMVIFGLYNMGKVPFSDVFIHGNILDGKGERMSKSKGNGIDPVDIIEKYGSDAMRYVLCDMQTGNQDIKLPVTAVCPNCDAHMDLGKVEHGKSIFTYRCAQCTEEFDVLGTMPDVPAAKLISERFVDGSKFCNKLWNTARFAFAQLENVKPETLRYDELAIEDRWILASLNRAIRSVTTGLSHYNPSTALGAARDFMWGDLCDWYLELIKPRLTESNEPSANVARQILAYCLDMTLRLLHPFVCYITEHLFQKLCELRPEKGLPGLVRESSESAFVIGAAWPMPVGDFDDDKLLKMFADLQATTTGIRDIRSTYGISPSQAVRIGIKTPPEEQEHLSTYAHVILRLANVTQLDVDSQLKRPPGAASKVVGKLQIFVHDLVDDEEEIQRLKKEIKKVEKEIELCNKKLGNQKFISKAPAEVVKEQEDRLLKYETQYMAITTALQEIEMS